MTMAKKYDDMLTGFADLLKEKNSEMWFKDFEIENLKKKLEAAEARIKELEDGKHAEKDPEVIKDYDFGMVFTTEKTGEV